MFNVFLCIATEHNWWLLGVAVLVCIAATSATFFLYSKTPSFPLWRRWTWLAMTGCVAGSGIWTTHFVAMIAFKTGLPTGYGLVATLASLGVAIVSTMLGFAVASMALDAPRRWRATIAGGLMVGLGITLMHYTGMSGYRTAGTLSWNGGYVAASVVIGALAASAALFVATPAVGWRRRLIGAALLSLGILGMHFTGMTAVTILPDPDIVVPVSLMTNAEMIAAAISGSALILVTAVLGVAFDTASRNGSLRRLREALDALPEGLAFYDASDRLVAWNTHYAELCRDGGAELTAGVKFSEVLAAKIVHGAYPSAKGREAEWIAERRAVRQGAIPSLTDQTASGRWLRITERRTSDGGVVSVSVDITDLKHNEAAMAAALAKAEEEARRAESAEAIAGMGHWRLDVATGQVTWSAQTYAIYGLPVGIPLDVPAIAAMVHPEDAEDRARLRERQISTGEPDHGSITRIVTPEGDIRHLSISSVAERGPDGEVAALIGTVVDVTDQQVLEAELRQARAEAEAAAAVKGEFLANMSHELRTPLTSIIGFTGLAAQQDDLSELSRTYIDRVADASRALLCTVNDILDFSKLEAGQVSIQREPVSLDRLSRATLDLFTPQAAAKDLHLTLDADPDGADLIVSVDPDRIRQILLNLVGNAVKFTACGGVTLRTRYDDQAERLRVEVIDTGEGVEPDKQGRLFKRFSQIDGSLTRAQGGTGLGLAICKGLVEAMDGDIGVESALGEGSRFWFEIPAPRSSLAKVEVEETMADRSALAGARILVVDDHPMNRELARLFLTGVGADITEAADGEEAVRTAAHVHYDVILMDVRMPRLDGPAALSQIRAGEGPNKTTPVLAFTADADAGTTDHLLGVGFQDLVTKPIAPGLLIAAVARAVAPVLDADTLARAG